MKVLLLVHGLPIGGTEVMVCHLARFLRRAGIETGIGCLDDIGELGDELVREGFDVRCYGRRPGFDAALSGRIARHVRSGSYRLVHAHQYTCFFYSALARALRRFPLVFTEHGRFYPDRPSWKRRVFNRVAGRAASRVTAVSRGVKQSLVEIEGFPEERIEVIYNGIELGPPAGGGIQRTALRERLGIAPGSRVAGAVGRLDPIKNHSLLLHAFARVAGRIADAELVVVGDGPERCHLEALASSLGVAPRVRFLGSRRDARTLLAAFDVFTMTSLSEGTPMTLLEAMAARVPIISTAVGGIPEVLEAGSEAILVPGEPPDLAGTTAAGEDAYVERFANELERLLVEPSLRERLADGAHARVSRDFSVTRVCRRYLEIFSALTGERPPAAAAERLTAAETEA